MKKLLKTLGITLIVFGLFGGIAYDAHLAFAPKAKVQASYLTVAPVAPHWIKVTKTFSDFSTAGFSNTIPLIVLPAKSVVVGTVMNPRTPFTGGLISAYSISVGITSNVDLMPASSAFTTPTRPWMSNLIVAGTVGGTEQVYATAISVTGLLNTATAGTVDIYLLVSNIE